MKQVIHKVSFSWLLLLVLPVIHVYLSGLQLSTVTAFYINGPDPSYAYLFNGLNLASGHFEVGHIDHPGTPMQYFVALVVYVRHFFCGVSPLPDDVLNDPESYLRACCIALSYFLGGGFLLIGIYVYRKTGDLFWSLLFQVTPLIVPYGFNHITVPRPEAFIVMAGSFLSAWLFVNYKELNEGKQFRKILVLSALSAFLVTLKISCIPFVVGLFLMITGTRRKLLYAVLFILFVTVLALPALVKFSLMKGWVIRLLTHDGIYGGGNDRFADPRLFRENLATIFTVDHLFTTTMALFFLSILFMKKKKASYDRALALLTLGVSVILFLSVVLVAKHYSFHYLIPVYPLLVLSLYISFRNLGGVLTSSFLRSALVKWTGFTLIVLLLYNRMNNTMGYAFSSNHNFILDTQEYIKKQRNKGYVITSEYESAFIEPSLNFGIVYSGEQRFGYFDYMNKRYPDSYLYRIGDKRLSKWNVEYQPADMLKNYKEMLVYFKGVDSTTEVNVLDRLSDSSQLFDYKKTFRNDRSGESIYLITSNSTALMGASVAH